MKQKVKISTYSIVLTILGIAILVGLSFFELIKGNENLSYIPSVALIILGFFALFYVPLSISVDNQSLVITRPICIKTIPLSEIVSIELCPPTMSEIRICGSGGWFGYWGWFKEPSIGKYFAYYGKSSDCFLVKLKDNRQYLLGCENPSSIVEYINSKIND